MVVELNALKLVVLTYIYCNLCLNSFFPEEGGIVAYEIFLLTWDAALNYLIIQSQCTKQN